MAGKEDAGGDTEILGVTLELIVKEDSDSDDITKVSGLPPSTSPQNEFEIVTLSIYVSLPAPEERKPSLRSLKYCPRNPRKCPSWIR